MIISTRVKHGDAILRNGFIKNVQVLEFWYSHLHSKPSVMINAGNDRTGLFNGHITVDADAMAVLCRKFLVAYNKEQANENSLRMQANENS